ncbi:peptidase G1 [Butyriboletus roseoflavus]|nr:peptidase G1 [Butyriboletus roseoflavus]
MATFAVPTLWDERGGFSMTIGLDGLECHSALQTGVEVSITDGVPLSKAWYGWWPEYKEDFPYISVSPGDVIDAYVVSTSATTGSVIMVNLSTGNISSVTPTTSESYPLCGRNAEWLVEAVLKDGTPTTLGNFSTARFTDAIACGPNFTYYGPTTGDISAIVQNETFLTFVNTAADNILIQYL